jgi:hypothetical protein
MEGEEDEADDGEEEEEEKRPIMKKPSSILKKPMSAFKSTATPSMDSHGKRYKTSDRQGSTPESTTRSSRSSLARGSHMRLPRNWPGLQLASM